MDNDARIKRSYEKHPEWDDNRRAEALILPVARVREVVARIKPAAGPPKASVPGMSKAEFLAEYDPTTKMRNLLKAAVALILENRREAKRPEDRARFYKDHEIRRLVGLGGGDAALWRSLATDPAEGFAPYQFRMGDYIWWSDPDSVREIISTHHKAKAVA